ncbi:MAG: hypothetical protein NC078_07625 [Ruminococcus sp.]|nr:hypothetical protein [Ruminococcus sp.]
MKLKKMLAAVTSTVIAAGMFAALPSAVGADDVGEISVYASVSTEPIELLSAPIKIGGTYGDAESENPGAIRGDIPMSGEKYWTNDYERIELDYTVVDDGNGGNLEINISGFDGTDSQIGWINDTSHNRNNYVIGLLPGEHQKLGFDFAQYPNKFFTNVGYCLYAGIYNAEGVEIDCDITINSITLYPETRETSVSFDDAEVIVSKYPFKIEGNYSADEFSVGSTFENYPYSRQPLYSNDYESLVMDYTVKDSGNGIYLSVYLACGTQAINSNEGPLLWNQSFVWDDRGLPVGEHQQLVFDLTKYPDTYFSAVGYFLANPTDPSLAGQPCTADITVNGVWLTKRKTTEQLTRTVAENVTVEGTFGELKDDGAGFKYSNLSGFLEGYANTDYRNVDVGKYGYMEVDYTVNDPGNAYQLGVEFATADYSNIINAGSWQNGLQLTAGEHQKFYLDFSDKAGNTFNYIYYYLVSDNGVSNTPFTGDITINSVKFYPKNAAMPQKENVTLKVTPTEVTVHSLDIYEQIEEVQNNLTVDVVKDNGEYINKDDPFYHTRSYYGVSAASEGNPGQICLIIELEKETAAHYSITGGNAFYITTNYSSRSIGTYKGIGYTDSFSVTADRGISAVRLNELIRGKISNTDITLKGFDGSSDYKFGQIGSALTSVTAVTPGESSYTVDVVLDSSKLFIEGDTYIPDDKDITLGYSENVFPDTVTVSFNVDVTYTGSVPVNPDTPDTPVVPSVPSAPSAPSVPSVRPAVTPEVSGTPVPTDVNTGAAVTGAKALTAAAQARPGDNITVVMTGNDNAGEILDKIKYKKDVTVNLKYSGYTFSVNSDDLTDDFEGTNFYSSARFLTAKEKSAFSGAKELRQIQIKNFTGIEKASVTVTMRGGSKGLPASALERTSKGKFKTLSNGKVGEDMAFSFEITSPGNYVVYSGTLKNGK